MLLALILFGTLVLGSGAASAAATFPTSPLLDNAAADSSLNPGFTTPALGEGRMTLDPVAHELTGVDHGAWDAALWNTPFAAPVEVWATFVRAGTNTAALYANITGGASGTTHPASGYFAAFDGSQSGGARDEVSLWRIDSGTERFMTGVASPFTDLKAGDQIGMSVSASGVIIAWYKPSGGSWTAAVSWHDPLYGSGNVAVEAIPGADYGFSQVGGGTPATPVQSTITTTSIRSSTSSVNPGQPVIYTATVSPVPDGGTVAFADAGVPIPGCAAQTINSSGNATCAVTYTTPGSHVVTAVYSGSPDGAFAGSDNTPDATVGVIQATPIVVAVTQPTKTRLAVSNATPAIRAAVRYSATVSPTPDGGTVSFRDRGALIHGCNSVAVRNGAASCNVKYRATGTHQIVASYGGNTHFGASATSMRRITVSKRPVLSIGKHRFIVTAVCPARSGGCRLTSNVAATIRGVKKAISPKRLSARIKAGKTKRFTFLLNGAAYTALRSELHRHHGAALRVTVRIVVRDGNGSSGTQTFTFTVSSARALSRLS